MYILVVARAEPPRAVTITVVSGSGDSTLKVWDDVEGMMARLVAVRRTPVNFDKRLIGRLIARFL